MPSEAFPAIPLSSSMYNPLIPMANIVGPEALPPPPSIFIIAWLGPGVLQIPFVHCTAEVPISLSDVMLHGWLFPFPAPPAQTFTTFNGPAPWIRIPSFGPPATKKFCRIAWLRKLFKSTIAPVTFASLDAPAKKFSRRMYELLLLVFTLQMTHGTFDPGAAIMPSPPLNCVAPPPLKCPPGSSPTIALWLLRLKQGVPFVTWQTKLAPGKP